MGCLGKKDSAIFVPHIGMFKENSMICAGAGGNGQMIHKALAI